MILRSRASYQTTLEAGRSAVETAATGAGAAELSEIWTFIERFAFPRADARHVPMAAE